MPKSRIYMICPHCRTNNDPNADLYWQDGDTIKCCECGEDFIVEVVVETYYVTGWR